MPDIRLTPEQTHYWMSRLEQAPRLNSLSHTFEELGAGNIGKPENEVVLNPDLLSNDKEAIDFAQALASLSGNFDQHYVASIPYSREEEARLGAALLRYSRIIATEQRRPAKVYITSGADGPVPRALAQLAGQQTVETLTCSPNSSNQTEFYERGAPVNASFFLGPYFSVTPAELGKRGLDQFSEGFDIIQADTTFQMYDADRYFQIALVRRNLRKDGIFLMFEKLLHINPNEYWRREYIKDTDFKMRFFNSDQIERKRDTVLTQMEQMQVTLPQLTETLRAHFTCATIAFNSGNFYNIAAADDPDQLLRFIAQLGPPANPARYQHHQLPEVLFGPAKFQPRFMV